MLLTTTTSVAQGTRCASRINGPAAPPIIANKGTRCRHYVHVTRGGTHRATQPAGPCKRFGMAVLMSARTTQAIDTIRCAHYFTLRLGLPGLGMQGNNRRYPSVS